MPFSDTDSNIAWITRPYFHYISLSEVSNAPLYAVNTCASPDHGEGPEQRRASQPSIKVTYTDQDSYQSGESTNVCSRQGRRTAQATAVPEVGLRAKCKNGQAALTLKNPYVTLLCACIAVQ